MMFSKLYDLRRWGALSTILVLSLALAACGDDAGNNGTSNNGTSNNGTADAGTDAVDDDAGGDTGGDAGTDIDDDASAAALEIIGSYDNNFGGTETIISDTWTMQFPDSPAIDQAIVDYDNDANYAVTQNPDDAQYSPSKFNKNVWTEPDTDGSFYYCTVTFGEDTAEAAANTDLTADDSDPANGGCGGAPWTLLTPQ